jgi:hypothetical protein
LRIRELEEPRLTLPLLVRMVHNLTFIQQPGIQLAQQGGLGFEKEMCSFR